jgi:hypothetical protein
MRKDAAEKRAQAAAAKSSRSRKAKETRITQPQKIDLKERMTIL